MNAQGLDAQGKEDQMEKSDGGATSPLQHGVMHSFTDKKGARWTACSECNRGGNRNDKDKCSCGWKCTEFNGSGCFIGTEIVGEIKPRIKPSKSKARYQRFLEYGDGFNSFLDYCYWDGNPDRQWNGGCA